MHAIVVYESMFGNTRTIAEAIADELRDAMDVEVLRADQATEVRMHSVDLFVVGAPTHAWGLPRVNTRKGSVENVRKSHGDLVLEPGADSLPGVREWLGSLGSFGALGAAFDTRLRAPALVTGRASKAIATSLERHGLSMVLPARSFLVDRTNHLVSGEVERAHEWGLQLKNEALDRLGVHH